MLRKDADYIIKHAIRQVLPDAAVAKALREKDFVRNAAIQGKDAAQGKLYVAAAGKAAWQMAHAAWEILGEQITRGVVVTKYDHVKGEIPGMVCFEAGHPVPDKNSFLGTEAVLDMVKDLTDRDRLIRILPSVQMPWRL